MKKPSVGGFRDDVAGKLRSKRMPHPFPTMFVKVLADKMAQVQPDLPIAVCKEG